jgi:hypothetical protein
MALVVPTASENQMLETLLGLDSAEDLVICLYVNNITPSDTDTLATYTEMSTLGYANKTLLKSSWTVAQAASKAEGSYAQQSWTFTSGTAVTVYGYFVKRATTGDLWYAERFTTPHTVQNTGDTIRVTPKLTLSKE